MFRVLYLFIIIFVVVEGDGRTIEVCQYDHENEICLDALGHDCQLFLNDKCTELKECTISEFCYAKVIAYSLYEDPSIVTIINYDERDRCDTPPLFSYELEINNCEEIVPPSGVPRRERAVIQKPESIIIKFLCGIILLWMGGLILSIFEV